MKFFLTLIPWPFPHSLTISSQFPHILSISSFSVPFLILCPFPHSFSISSQFPHFLSISSFSLHFLAARLQGCNRLRNPDGKIKARPRDAGTIQHVFSRVTLECLSLSDVPHIFHPQICPCLTFHFPNISLSG